MDTTPEALLTLSPEEKAELSADLKKKLEKLPKDTPVIDPSYIPEVYTMAEVQRMVAVSDHLVEMITKLADLYKDGLLTEEEFSQAKKKLLEG